MLIFSLSLAAKPPPAALEPAEGAGGCSRGSASAAPAAVQALNTARQGGLRGVHITAPDLRGRGLPGAQRCLSEEEKLTVLNKPQRALELAAAAATAELQSKPFSKQRSSFTLCMLQAVSSEGNAGCSSHLRWSHSQANTPKTQCHKHRPLITAQIPLSLPPHRRF